MAIRTTISFLFNLICFLTREISAQETSQGNTTSIASDEAGQSAVSAACSSEGDTESSYSTSWHIASLFIVLAVSGLGMLVSVFLGMASQNASTHSPNSSRTIIIQKALQLAKMFGIGIIAGTAWIHLLPEAFALFSDPCLDPWWSFYGTNWVGIFGLAAAFMVQLIELAGHSHVKKTYGHSHSHHGHSHSHHGHSHSHHPHHHEEVSEERADLTQTLGNNSVVVPTDTVHTDCHSISTNSQDCHSVVGCPIADEVCESTCDAHVTMGLEHSLRAIHYPTDVIRKSLNDNHTHGNPKPAANSNLFPSNEARLSDCNDNGSSGVAILQLNHQETEDSKNTQMKLHMHSIKRISTFVLEAGILAHSLIIGLTLGVTSDSSFSTLLIAVSFHQLFEGIALGVLVGDTNLSRSSKIILGLLYPIATPVGIGIGIAIHSVYESSQSSLILTQGIFESLSSGILIYSTYCELVGNEINHNPTFDRFSQTFKFTCFLSMYLGAAAMAVLGIWA